MSDSYLLLIAFDEELRFLERMCVLIHFLIVSLGSPRAVILSIPSRPCKSTNFHLVNELQLGDENMLHNSALTNLRKCWFILVCKNRF